MLIEQLNEAEDSNRKENKMTVAQQAKKLTLALSDARQGKKNSIFLAELEHEVLPALANECLNMREGQAWSSPREMEAAKHGDYPHGTVDVIDDEWARIWIDHQDKFGWYNTHNTLRKFS